MVIELIARLAMLSSVIRLITLALLGKTRSSLLAGMPPGEVVDQFAGLFQLALAPLPVQVVVAGVRRTSSGSTVRMERKRPSRLPAPLRSRTFGKRRESQRRQVPDFMVEEFRVSALFAGR